MPARAYAAYGAYGFITYNEDVDDEDEYTLVIKMGKEQPDVDTYGVTVKDWSSEEFIGEEGSPIDLSAFTSLSDKVTPTDGGQTYGISYPWVVDASIRTKIVRVVVEGGNGKPYLGLNVNGMFSGLVNCKEFNLYGLSTVGQEGYYEYNNNQVNYNSDRFPWFMFGCYDYDAQLGSKWPTYKNYNYPCNAPCLKVEKIITGPYWTLQLFHGLFTEALQGTTAKAQATTFYTVARTKTIVERTPYRMNEAMASNSKVQQYGSRLPEGTHVYYRSQEEAEANIDEDYKFCYGTADPSQYRDQFYFSKQPDSLVGYINETAYSMNTNTGSTYALEVEATYSRGDGMPTDSTLTYQWYKADNLGGANAQAITRGTSNRLDYSFWGAKQIYVDGATRFSLTQAGCSYYYAIAKDPETGATGMSNVVKIVGYDRADGPRISSQAPYRDAEFPSQYTYGELADELYVNLADISWFVNKYDMVYAPTVLYQWYQSYMGGEWEAVEGATESTFTPSTRVEPGLYSYYCQISYVVNTYSKPEPVIITTASSDAFYFEIDLAGAEAGAIECVETNMEDATYPAMPESVVDLSFTAQVPHGTVGDLTYQWFASKDGTVGEEDEPLTEKLMVPEDGTITYTPSYLPGNKYYYCVVNNRVYTDNAEANLTTYTSKVVKIFIDDALYISTFEQLKAARDNADNLNGYKLVLEADLELDATWASGFAITGIDFDGKGHTVTNYSSYPLFRLVYGSTIKNLKVVGTGSCGSGLAAAAYRCTIDGVVSYGTVGSASYTSRAAGLVNSIYNCVIKNCGNEANVSASTSVHGWPDSYYSAAGLVGAAYGRNTITSCYNTGFIYAGVVSGLVAGALPGEGVEARTESSAANEYEKGTFTMTDCYNSGTLKGALTDTPDQGTAALSCGLAWVKKPAAASTVTTPLVMKNCYNTGNLTSLYGSVSEEESYIVLGYGGVYNGSTAEIETENLYYLDSLSAQSKTYATSVSAAALASSDMVGTLNGEGGTAWKEGAIYPILSWQDVSGSGAAPVFDAVEFTSVTTTQNVSFAPISATAGYAVGLRDDYKGTISYQWYKQETDEEGNTSWAAIDGATEASYTPACDQLGTAKFQCVAKNTLSDGSAYESTSCTYTATVLTGLDPATPLFINAPESTTVKYGEPLELSFLIGYDESEGKGQGTITQQWYRMKGEEPLPSVDFKMGTNPTYTPSTSMTSVYTYYVVVTNTFEGKTATAQSEPATITIEATISVSTPAELKQISDAVLAGTTYRGVTIELANDIDLSSDPDTASWQPIGLSSSKYFAGTFDGKGYTIKGMNVEWLSSRSTGSQYLGLFGYCRWATIQNLTVIGSVDTSQCTSASMKNYIGGIVAYSYGDNAIKNVAARVDINATAGGYIGGIIGSMSNRDKITNCVNYGNVRSTSTGTTAIGGIAGSSSGSNAVFTNCANRGSVSAQSLSATNSGIGGIVGLDTASGTSSLNNCYSTGTITLDGGNYSGASVQGPVFGRITQSAFTANNCYYLEGSSMDADGNAVLGYYHNADSPLTSKTESEFASADMVDLLNGEIAEGEEAAWKKGVSSPMLAFEKTDLEGLITIYAQPQDAAYQPNTSKVEPLTVVASGKNISYQWYSNTVASTEGATALTGATASEFTPVVTTPGTTYYYCVLKTASTEETSDIAKVVVVDAIPAATPIITAQPQSASVQTFGEAEPMTIVAGFAEDAQGVGELSYQWYRNGEAIEGATEASYVPASDKTATYYCEVTNTYQIVKTSTVRSDDAILTCNNEIVNISTVAELLAVRDAVNKGTTYAGKTIVMEKGTYDLSTVSIWTPIGSYPGYGTKYAFEGVFDGSGSTIIMKSRDLTNTTNGHNAGSNGGLFDYVSGGTIMNLNITGDIGCYYNHIDGYGMLVGYIEDGVIENVHVSGSMFQDTTRYYDGGVVGSAFNTTINNVSSDVDITVGYIPANWETYSYSSINSGGYAGGIVGRMTGGSLTNATSYGTVWSVGGNASGIAGLVAGGTVEQCVSYADILRAGGRQYSPLNSRTAFTEGRAGGIAAHATEDATINGCINHGSVSGSNMVGGLVGQVDSAKIVISNCYNDGTIGFCAKNTSCTFGGLVGTLAEGSLIKNAYNSGAVNGCNAGGMGGLSGSARASQLANCYYTAKSYPKDSSNLEYIYDEELVSEEMIETLNADLDPETGEVIEAFVFNPNGAPKLWFEAPFYVAESGVSMEEGSFVYTGSTIEPEVTVEYRGTQLVQDVDYTVEYANNVAPGTATATVTCLGDYVGTFELSFTIESGSVTVKVSNAQKYTGASDPKFGFVVEGLAPNDEVSSIQLSREAGEMAGKFAITASDIVIVRDGVIVTDMYNVTYVDGELQIVAPVDPEQGIKGDVNGNGLLNIVDAQIAYDIATQPVWLDDSYKTMIMRADIDGDGFVTANDAFAIQYAVIHGWSDQEA